MAAESTVPDNSCRPFLFLASVSQRHLCSSRPPTADRGLTATASSPGQPPRGAHLGSGCSDPGAKVGRCGEMEANTEEAAQVQRTWYRQTVLVPR